MSAVDVASALTWILGAVFVYSGLTKLYKPGQATETVAEYGVPFAKRAHLGLLLGIVETVLGVFSWTSQGMGTPVWRLSILLSLLLLALFVLAQGHSLLTDRQHSCGCFGEDTPVSYLTLLRTSTIVFGAAVTLLLAGGVESVAPVHMAFTGSLLGLLALVVALPVTLLAFKPATTARRDFE